MKMNDNKIYVSVIIPVYNAKKYLTYSLPAMRRSDYPNFEVIVVDDNSADGSSEFAEKYADIVLKMETKVAPAQARNKGASASKGEILFFIDSDVQIAPDSISRVVKAMKEDRNIAAVFGSYDDNPFYKNFFSQYKNLLHHFVHQRANPQAQTFWAGCGAIRREIFLKEDGFPEKYSSASIEDVELGYKLTEKGHEIRLLKGLQVTHLKKWNFVTLLKSDIVYRAIPWTRLACEKGLPLDLNFKLLDRISGIISCLLFINLVLMWHWNPLVLLSVTFAGVLFYLNRNLYKFFLKKRGILFTIRAILFHWFYFLYSSVTFAVFSVYFSLRNVFARNSKSGRT